MENFSTKGQVYLGRGSSESHHCVYQAASLMAPSPCPPHTLTGFGCRGKHSMIPPLPAEQPWAAVPGTSLECGSPRGVLPTASRPIRVGPVGQDLHAAALTTRLLPAFFLQPRVEQNREFSHSSVPGVQSLIWVPCIAFSGPGSLTLAPCRSLGSGSQALPCSPWGSATYHSI
jgi:hypothetical protein